MKPVPSRQMCRKTFIVHNGKDATSSVAFIEVRENGLIIRSVSGAVTDRWLFEELVNMTYSPKNKVICLWRRSEGLTEMQKYYTKKVNIDQIIFLINIFSIISYKLMICNDKN